MQEVPISEQRWCWRYKVLRLRILRKHAKTQSILSHWLNDPPVSHAEQCNRIEGNTAPVSAILMVMGLTTSNWVSVAAAAATSPLTVTPRKI